jgi:two-component system OmpR family sensor kinase
VTPARTPPPGRLFWKFFAACWLALLLASALVGGLLWIDAQATRPRQHVLDAGPLGRLLVDAAAAVATHGGRDALATWLAQTSEEERSRPAVFAIDADGRELLGRTLPAEAIAAARAGAATAGGGPRPALREISVDGGPVLLFVTAPPHGLMPPPGPDKSGRPIDARPRPPRPPWLGWVAPLSTGIVASLLLAALLAWYFARPIRALDAAFKRAGEGDLGVRVAPLIGRRRDEVADLGHAFDRMVQRIDGLLQAQRRLMHDVSHELRSPLARLQVCVGLARRDPAQAAQMLDRIERETERMDGLVEEILTLARLESGAGTVEAREPTDLAELLADAVDDVRIEAGQRQVAVEARIVRGGRIDAEATLLRRAIDNVLRNAVQHAPPGSTVDVLLDADANGDCLLRVADRGPGLSAVECSAMFQPFVRGRARSGSGFGLGLAIAQRAVQAHAGRIVARPREGGGLEVDVTLPR